MLAALFFFASCDIKTESVEIAFYVSPEGEDANKGTSAESPFATLEQARDAIRNLKRAGGLTKPVRVYLRGGLYVRAKPFVLTSEDSGTDEFPVTYRSYADEKPVISGGKQVKEWNNTTLNGHKVVVADLSQLKDGYTPFEQLWVNGRRAIQARTPNSGYLKVPNSQGADTKTLRRERSYDFSYDPDDEQLLDGADDGVAVVFNKWLEYHMPIDRIDHKNKKIVSTKKGGRAIEGEDDFYLEGGRNMLDQPGEWYLDRSEDKLYYYPRGGEQEFVATIPVLISVLRMDGDARNNQYIEHIEFKGLTFSHTTWILPRDVEESGYSQADIRMDGALRLTGIKNCLFEECEITAIGNYGMELSLGCTDNRIIRCDIHDLGAGGLLIGPKIRPRVKEDKYAYIPNEEFPPVLDHPSHATGNNEIADCSIYDGGRYFHCAVGIWIGQSPNNKIHHNEIYDFYYSAISSGWTWGYGPALATGNSFEYNYIHHIGKRMDGDGGVLSDLGGIYTLGDQTGTVIRHNVFHDIWAGKYGGWAIYCDEGSRNILIENNLAYRCKHACFDQHYGKDNLIRNNIFAFAKTSVAMMARIQPHTGFILKNNILLSDGTPMYAGGYEYNVDQKGAFVSDSNLVWSTAGEVLGAQNRFPSRLYEPNEPVMSWETWVSQGNDQNTIIADPLFKDPENGDFSLAENSPALKIGFNPFPLGMAGPR